MDAPGAHERLSCSARDHIDVTYPAPNSTYLTNTAAPRLIHLLDECEEFIAENAWSFDIQPHTRTLKGRYFVSRGAIRCPCEPPRVFGATHEQRRSLVATGKSDEYLPENIAGGRATTTGVFPREITSTNASGTIHCRPLLSACPARDHIHVTTNSTYLRNWATVTGSYADDLPFVVLWTSGLRAATASFIVVAAIRSSCRASLGNQRAPSWHGYLRIAPLALDVLEEMAG
uniref:Uncharacterized protein n=1 Tax=Mycena chlorophos TaxID=658473 RepID=A0ABQ0LRG5_MYCCL|nr:predicted protein [Mycena chlorophos]